MLLLFLVPGLCETLRVAGTASVETDPAVLARLEHKPGGRAPKAALRVEIVEAYLHCGKALLRSKLWDDASRRGKDEFPSLAKCLVDQLAAKGVDIAFAKPKSGAVIIRSSAQIVKNNQDPKLVLDYLDTVMSAEAQKGIEAAPWVMMPTNKNVALTGANLTVAKSVDDLIASNVLLDWTKFQHMRGEWITRFNKDVKI